MMIYTDNIEDAWSFHKNIDGIQGELYNGESTYLETAVGEKNVASRRLWLMQGNKGESASW